MDSAEDPSFAALSSQLRKRIDRAFDSVLDSTNVEPGPAPKRRKVTHEPEPELSGGFLREDPQPGGFIVDSESGGFVVDASQPGEFVVEAVGGSDAMTGGFLVEEAEHDEDISAHNRNHIPFSLIPTALQLLDLPPDDEDVLSVFRNAASGWAGDTSSSRAEHEDSVSRKDWRAVCAALLDSGDPDVDVDVQDSINDVKDADRMSELSDHDSGNSGEEYVESDEPASADESDDSGDEYQEGGVATSPSKPKRNASTKARTSSPFPDTPTSGPTPRQKDDCRRTFALFFPDVPDNALDKQRIMIKDISRVAKLLKEKITVEEVRFLSSSLCRCMHRNRNSARGCG